MNNNKYRNKKIMYNGMTFDSKKELKRYQELQLMEKGGAIFDLCRQVKYELIPAQRDIKTGRIIERQAIYIADFVYKRYTKDGGLETVVEDVKGYRTQEYILKRKLMLFHKGIRITEI